MSSTTAVITTRDAEDNIWFGGGLVSFKVTTEQSGGALVLHEHAATRGKRTPLHLHPDYDEAGILLEGELLLHIDGVEHRVGSGASIWIPRGVPHALLITSDVARSVWVVTPGGAMEQFFRQAGDVATDRTLPPPEFDIARVVAVGESTGAMKVLGPPPFPED